MYQQALEMTKRLFSADHPNMASSLNNLAVLYYRQRRYQEAEPLLQQALEMRKRLFSADHPDVANSLNNLAGLYSSQGRYSKAEPLYKEALVISEQTLGADHPHTMTVRASYANCLKEMSQKKRKL